jgi:hypothetical protein
MQRNDDHLRQGRSLFLQTVHDVIAASKSLTNDDSSSSSNDNDEATRLDDCARIRFDGSIISSSNNDGEDREQFTTAFCLPPSRSSRGGGNTSNLGGGIGNECQMKTVAQLSAIHLVGPYGKAAPTNNNPSSSDYDNIATGAKAAGGRWYETITSKVNRIIDMALATFDGSSADDELRYLDSTYATNNSTIVRKTDGGDEEDDVNNVKKLLLATENHANSSNVKLDDDNICDHSALVEVEICDTDTVIDLVTLAVTCRYILTYINQLISLFNGDELKSHSNNKDNNEKYFFIPRTFNDNPQHQRIMLHRVGWGTSSFGALCLQAAKAAQGSSSNSSTNSTILSNISQDIDLELIVQTLIESNYAVVQGGGDNGDVITIYPHGVPSTPPSSIKNEKSASSSLSVVDMALFQIHNTKITIQTRLTQLETNATQSKVAAIQAQQSDMTQTQQIALRHMRHYKLLMSEIAHCTTLLTNLDTMELQLYRSVNDKQIVHSYTLVKEAYQMIRKSATTTTTTTTGSINGSGGVVVDGSGVDELIMDIQDEIDEMNEISNAILLPSSNVKDSSSQDIDEDELNVEFHRLELECLEERQQKQQRPQQQRPTVEEVDSNDDNKLEPLIPAPVQIIEQPSSSDGVSEEINNARQSQQQRQKQQQQQGDSQAKALPA